MWLRKQFGTLPHCAIFCLLAGMFSSWVDVYLWPSCECGSSFCGNTNCLFYHCMFCLSISFSTSWSNIFFLALVLALLSLLLLLNQWSGLSSLCIASDGSGTELLIVLVRHNAQRFDCVNSFEITCSAALTDPHGRVSQHYKARLNVLTPATGCSGRYAEETDFMFYTLSVCPLWFDSNLLKHGP